MFKQIVEDLLAYNLKADQAKHENRSKTLERKNKIAMEKTVKLEHKNFQFLTKKSLT